MNDIRVDYDDPGSATVATEFAGTSISSDFSTFVKPVIAALPDNPHVRDFEGELRGYVVARVDRDRWTSDYRVVDTVDEPTSPASADPGRSRTASPAPTRDERPPIFGRILHPVRRGARGWTHADS